MSSKGILPPYFQPFYLVARIIFEFKGKPSERSINLTNCRLNTYVFNGFLVVA
jgi:hypothetical protein